MGSDVVGYSVESAIARVTLNRPEKLNAINPAVLDELETCFLDAGNDPQVRAVVLAGHGRCFCAGADLEVVTAIAGDAAAFGAFLTRWHDVFGVIETCPKPTIAAVHGYAFAGGLELTQVCDLVVVAHDARMGDQHAKFGLFPGGGSTQRLTRQLRRRDATWLLLSGESVDGTRAVELGLANCAVDPDQVLESALGMGRQLAELSAAASRQIKIAIRSGAHLALDDALELERRLAVEHMQSDDAAEGLNAFEQRRKPDFVNPRGRDETRRGEST